MHLSPAFLSLVLLWSSSSVVALAVVERSSEARLDDPNGMAWTGKVFPNGPDVTMFGDAEHILALNPGYAPEDSWHALQNVTSEASKIQKRVPTGANPNGFFCGVYSTGDRGDLNSQYDYLARLGGSCGAPARECRRMTCGNTSATYFCNDGSSSSSASCSTVASYVFYVNNQCCPWSRAVSGQLFSNQGPWNILSQYGNCNHSPNKRPGDYTGAGPNGQCSS